MKRKPKYASPEFWGGKKKVWENGKQIEVEMEGWVAEMYEKTMKREIYGSKRIPRDPDKVDESYNYIRQREQQYEDMVIEAEIVQNANVSPIQLPEGAESKSIEDAASEHLPVADKDGADAPDEFDANPDF